MSIETIQTVNETYKEYQRIVRTRTEQFKASMEMLYAARDDANRHLIQTLEEHYGAAVVRISGHLCEESPIGLCVYDMASYMADDECLICHDPSERK